MIRESMLIPRYQLEEDLSIIRTSWARIWWSHWLSKGGD